MKVKELIEALSKCDPEKEILPEWEGIVTDFHAITEEDNVYSLHVDTSYYYDHYDEKHDEIKVIYRKK